ncbi:alpha/beta hydrolase [Pseudomonas fragi]|uniref:alpha/beta hydrolase n=1 Tax=Pseudomonas fragi TaxID=296 RepID=UPI001065C2BC|nr:alpha/beta hydrolase [Pseudomonas fragi]NNB13477.1 alpha/beta hydrolase [Pseudomonas fragi]NNB19734.1 alpha/beta hydrolase [Pseudomonas fragi]
MPAPFSPDSLRANLQPLAAGQPLSSEALAYQRFYGLDFPHRTPAPKRQLGCFSAGGYQLVSQVWWPDSPPVATLFVIHGFYDHMGLYRHVIEWGLNRGFVVIACDLPGHGLSSGERASIDDFAQYQAVLQGLFIEAQSLHLPQPWHLCGQSTGGAIVLDHLLRYGEQSPAQGKAILLSPLVRPKDWGWSKLSYYLLRPFVKGIARRFSENSNDPAFLPFLQADPLQPLRLPTAWVGALARWIPRIENASPSARQPLVVQGQADKTVDWQHNLEVLKTRFNQPRVLLLPEARHHLANETAAIREQYFGFLDQYL